ncbi:hypothetical protein ACNF49_40940 [Actinomadura sp. ATCC 39365]
MKYEEQLLMELKAEINDRVERSELAKAGVRARPAGELLERVAEELERCHAALIAPLMDQLGAILDADVDRQARRLAEGGVEGMLTHLHTQVA